MGSVSTLEFAGDDVTTYLAKLLEENKHSFITKQDFYYDRLMKEKYCWIKTDKEHESVFSQTILTEYKSAADWLKKVNSKFGVHKFLVFNECWLVTVCLFFLSITS